MSRNILFFFGALVLAGVSVLAFRSPSGKARRVAVASGEPPVSVSAAHEPASVITADPRAAVSSPGTFPTQPAVAPGEAAMMAQLRESLGRSSPEAILELAREVDARYPDGPQAEERSLYIIDSLIALDRLADMRDEARRHLSRWPNTQTAERVMARTGVHPEPKPLR